MVLRRPLFPDYYICFENPFLNPREEKNLYPDHLFYLYKKNNTSHANGWLHVISLREFQPGHGKPSLGSYAQCP